MARVLARLEQLAHRQGVVVFHWERRGGSFLKGFAQRPLVRPARNRFDRLIEQRAELTETAGSLPLWEGYGDSTASRSQRQVRTSASTGAVYRMLVQKQRPNVVVEIGTAFGVSGMYWLSGLESADCGTLLTFEPNEMWRRLAERNLEAIGTRFTSFSGTFEEHIDNALGSEQIDLAFIDAIHTREFVMPQFELVVARSRPGALVVLDDISFSEDMRGCWQELACDPRVAGALTLGRRVGVVELQPPSPAA